MKTIPFEALPSFDTLTKRFGTINKGRSGATAANPVSQGTTLGKMLALILANVKVIQLACIEDQDDAIINDTVKNACLRA